MFTVTCLEKNGLVGQSFLFLVFFFIFFFLHPKQLKFTYWLSLRFTSINLVFIKEKKKLKLLITCENFALFALLQFLFCFINIFLENVEKKVTVGGV